MAETTRQRQAFEQYWRLGKRRSIEQLHEVMKERGEAPNLRTLYEWSRRYHWQSRIAEAERQAAEAADEARLEALKDMYMRQAREGVLLQQKGAEWLTQLKAEGVSAEAAIRAIVEGAKLERLATGEPSEREEFRKDEGHDERFATIDDEELEILIEHAEGTMARAYDEEAG